MRRISFSLVPLALSLALAAPTPVAATTTVERSVAFTAALTCDGELVHLTGTMVFVSTFRFLQNDGLVFNFRTITHGTGISTSGAAYRWSHNSQAVQIRAPSDGSLTTFQNHFRLKGPTSTHTVRFTVHVSVLPSGELVAGVLNVADVCR